MPLFLPIPPPFGPGSRSRGRVGLRGPGRLLDVAKGQTLRPGRPIGQRQVPHRLPFFTWSRHPAASLAGSEVHLEPHNLIDLAEAGMEHVRGRSIFAHLSSFRLTHFDPILTIGSRLVEAMTVHGLGAPTRRASARVLRRRSHRRPPQRIRGTRTSSRAASGDAPSSPSRSAAVPPRRRRAATRRSST